jgi:hypothetical protein
MTTLDKIYIVLISIAIAAAVVAHYLSLKAEAKKKEKKPRRALKTQKKGEEVEKPIPTTIEEALAWPKNGVTKVCKKCEKEKGLDEFYLKNIRLPQLGVLGSCKKCRLKGIKKAAKKRAKKAFVVVVPKYKACNTCSKTLPSSLFSGATANKDGLQGKCKECMKTYNKKRVGK